jgi:hypothetical protein
MTPEEALMHEWVLTGLPPEILINHLNMHNISNEDIPLPIKKKLDRYLRRPKEDKKSANKSLSSKSNSTSKESSLSKKSSINNSLTRKRKTKKLMIEFSPKSTCEMKRSKHSKDARKSISKGKKKLKVSKKRKPRFIRKINDRKGINNPSASEQTATLEESSDEESEVRETSLPNKKTNNFGVFPNHLPLFGKTNRFI